MIPQYASSADVAQDGSQVHANGAAGSSVFREFLKNPGKTGAIIASSRSLAQAMVEPVDFAKCKAVAELGAGTGSLTQAILERLNSRTRFVSLEPNPELFAVLTRRWDPRHFARRGAEDLRAILDDRGIGQLDAIISALPWSNFSSDLRRRILDQIRLCLAPGGVLVIHMYLQSRLLPGGADLYSTLRGEFRQIRRRKIVWANLPPAVVHSCHRQNPGSM